MLVQISNLIKAIMSRSHWKCTSGLQKRMIFVCLYALLSCMLCFHVCTNMQIVRIFENRIPIKTFKKWHNVKLPLRQLRKVRNIRYWRTEVSFLKSFGERVEENHIYDLVKPNFTVKTKKGYRGRNICYQVFLENGKIDSKSKIWNFNINFLT